ncbi:MAG: DUF192 domain-containing protein [Rickettsiales bacterium]
MTIRLKHLNSLSFVCLILAIAFPVHAAENGQKTTLVRILTKKNPAAILAEVAMTDAEQETGLMYRSSLAENQGMLFPQDPPRRMQMWMKNTYIPLDMIFVGTEGRITMIAESTQPLSLDSIGPAEKVAAVLEVPAGTVKKLSIEEGDTVEYSLPTQR